jgi:hypothetical protein
VRGLKGYIVFRVFRSQVSGCRCGLIARSNEERLQVAGIRLRAMKEAFLSAAFEL